VIELVNVGTIVSASTGSIAAEPAIRAPQQAAEASNSQNRRKSFILFTPACREATLSGQNLGNNPTKKVPVYKQ
jgi:hypothetical protein